MNLEYVLPRIYIGSGEKGKRLHDRIMAAAKRRNLSLAAYIRLCVLYVDIDRDIPEISKVETVEPKS